MGNFFNIILYQPLFNLLVFLYVTFQDLGIATILMTIIIRTVLYPLFYKSFKNQTLMQKLQPEVQKIQHDHKENREKQAQALMDLYRRHKVSPFSGFLLILVQLPILIVLYNLFLKGLTPETFTNLYPFMTAPQQIHSTFLGLIDLKNPSILIVVLAVVLQYIQSRLSLPKTDKMADSPAARISRSMTIVGPILTLLILIRLPAAIGLYWLVSSGFSIGQQLLINKKLKNNQKSGNNERRIQIENQNTSRTPSA